METIMLQKMTKNLSISTEYVMRKNLGGPERGADPIQHMTYDICET